MLRVILFVFQKLAALAFIFCNIVPSGPRAEFKAQFLCGLPIAILGLLQPKYGFRRNGLNLLLSISSIAAIVIALIIWLFRALDIPGYANVIGYQLIVAMVFVIILLPMLPRRFPQFSLRTLILSVSVLALLGTIVANCFYERIRWHREEMPVVEYIQEMKGRVEYENWRVVGIDFGWSELRLVDFAKLAKLPNVKRLTLVETVLSDDSVPGILNCRHLKKFMCENSARIRTKMRFREYTRRSPK